MCVWFVFIPKNGTKSLPHFFLQTTAFQTIITKNLSFSKSRFSFCFLLNLKTNKIIKFGPKPELPAPRVSRVRSEFRRGQTPKQLDSATAVMTLAAATVAKPELLLLLLLSL